MNVIQSIVLLLILLWQGRAEAQRTLISAQADGNAIHSSTNESVVSSSGKAISSYSTSGTAPAKARPEEAFAYQLEQANELAIAINARRIQMINSKIQAIQFKNPFTNGESITGFTDWNKDKSKFDNTSDNEEYSTLSTSSVSQFQYMSGYVNYTNMVTKMTASKKSYFTEHQLDEDNRKDIQKDYLAQVADKTIDKTIDDVVEDEHVKARLKSIKEIHNASYDLFEKMVDEFFEPSTSVVDDEVDNFFKPYPPDLQARIDRFFGDYKDKVLTSFAKASPALREKVEDAEKDSEKIKKNIGVGDLIYGQYNSLKL